MSTDIKDTVFLPKTDFPMRAGLAKKEPEILTFWEEIDLYGKMQQQAKDEGREKFILHDGPPYANGNIHVGHAVNKILKDVVCRAKRLEGYDVPYVPGWDCHGLPIEWKIEEQYRKEGKDKDAVDPLTFRAQCRDFAAEWVGIQAGEFARLGVLGDWDNPYTTMTNEAEAYIVREIHKFVKNGGLYKGVKPVMWSVVEKTALAEAEVEYDDHKSVMIWVKFPVTTAPRPSMEDAGLLIWTTTPWTIPGNRAIAFGADLTYGVYEIDGTGEKLVICVDLADAVQQKLEIENWTKIDEFPGSDLAGTICAHPLRGVEGNSLFGFDVPALAGDFVTTEQGTGLVHVAPGHGADDFFLGQANGIEIPQTVGPDGVFYDHVDLFAGCRVYNEDGSRGDATGKVLGYLLGAGALKAKGSLRHSYPHSWRSKAPLIFRTTPQWFISMEENDLRIKALKEIDNVRWVPGKGRERIHAMIADRPDWCISRQRSWGVPIAVFVRKSDGQLLRDETVLDRIGNIFEDEGADAWFKRPAQDFLGNSYDADDFEQIFDIVDVWFESGSTHGFVCEERDELQSPADLYLEGSDQHRGWFHSSLLESVGTRGCAPYKTVLTHGFVLDEQGRKMSKSLGNVVKPQKVIDQYGADILRLWVLNCDYAEDIRVGNSILKAQTDLYRRLRNSLRYLLGALDGFTAAEKLDIADLPELEKWVLHRLSEIDDIRKDALENYNFHRYFTALHHFCAVDLSAFYFDIRKDSLYCDAPDALRRRATRTVMDIVFNCLTAWLAPILCFTAEEAWLARHGKEKGSVHLRRFEDIPPAWKDHELAERWSRLRRIRRVVTGAIELERAEKRIGSSLEAAPVVHITDSDDMALAQAIDMAELCITSSVNLSAKPVPDDAFTLDDIGGVGVVSKPADGNKCQRCWQVLEEVPAETDGGLCKRCEDAVKTYGEAAA